ncbi:MAG TPA: DNA replication and repair protein RecF [Polyangiaceae bacterium]
MRQRGLRNLKAIALDFSPTLNVLTGDNGQGKTSFLEALALAATSRSFRAEQSRDILQHGSITGYAEIALTEAGMLRQQRIEIAIGRKITSADGKRIVRTADYAVLTPLVVFHPADLNLVAGAAALRRTLLARVSLYTDPVSFESHKAYLRALRERQKLLSDHGPGASGLDAFEQVAAEHGALVARSNAKAAQEIISALVPILSRLAPAGVAFTVRHVANGSTSSAEFRQQLEMHRRTDQFRGRAQHGPHRDDLQIDINGADARRHASQGQQRLLALALKLAELNCIRSARNVHPVLLLDDVLSELDALRVGALYHWLDEIESQVFITTTHWQVADTLGETRIPPRHFRVHDGVAEQTSIHTSLKLSS